MADAIHNLVKTQLSSIAPYISMGRLYTKMVAVNLRRACAMRTFDVIENALLIYAKGVSSFQRQVDDCAGQTTELPE